MRNWSPSLRGVSFAWRLVYFGFLFLGLILAAMGLRDGPLFLTFAALVMLVPFIISAPFVFGARWRRPVPNQARRPVVRRRRY